ncbi:hypothetical protein BS50DRAFT_595196, partial [Corynespora cassiicola Philippines]
MAPRAKNQSFEIDPKDSKRIKGPSSADMNLESLKASSTTEKYEFKSFYAPYIATILPNLENSAFLYGIRELDQDQLLEIKNYWDKNTESAVIKRIEACQDNEAVKGSAEEIFIVTSKHSTISRVGELSCPKCDRSYNTWDKLVWERCHELCPHEREDYSRSVQRRYEKPVQDHETNDTTGREKRYYRGKNSSKRPAEKDGYESKGKSKSQDKDEVQSQNGGGSESDGKCDNESVGSRMGKIRDYLDDGRYERSTRVRQTESGSGSDSQTESG